MMASSESTNLTKIKTMPVPSSPRKLTSSLRCSVLNKSPLRPTQRGKMFTLNLFDKNPSSVIRAVCFKEDMFDSFQANTTYDIDHLKVKKAYGNTSACPVELLIDGETKVSKASEQADFQDIHTFYKVSQIVRGETDRFINFRAKVIDVDDAVMVGSYLDTKLKRSIQMADESGSVELVLWRDKAENFSFKVGDVLEVVSAVGSQFNNCKLVSSILETTFKKLDKSMTVSNAKPQRQHKSNVTSLSTYVLALKEFKCSVTCVACRKNISLIPDDSLITCASCKTMFLKEVASTNNHCLVLLGNKQWYSVNTGVIQHLFGWDSPRTEVTNDDVINVLKTKFSMRLDLDRKIVEHVAFNDLDAESSAVLKVHQDSHEAKKQKIASEKLDFLVGIDPSLMETDAKEQKTKEQDAKKQN